MAGSAGAQHADVLVQTLGNRLATGNADFDSGAWTLGRRVYPSEFGSNWSVNNPGFNALAANSPSMPVGASRLPGNTSLTWDFMPMKIGGVLQNAFYWDGVGSTVAAVDFGVLPGPEYEIALYGRNAPVAVDGAPSLVAGDVIDVTSSSGALHSHRYFYLDSGNQNTASSPADGIYLLSLRMKMNGYDPSQPIYMVLGTPGSTLAALQAAESWVNAWADELAPDFDADFNGDWVVDGSDFLVWQRNFGATNARLALGDADRDGIVGAGDLAVWRDEFGLSIDSFPGAVNGTLPTPAVSVIPEPGSAVLFLLGFSMLARCTRTRAKRRASLASC
ncbi:hypothetical protein [Lacipirellula sp.]|uniref:hypothetical protein n=1 Tax=Lacipirellula sp. TaxID=2691419 RepID=UPI003D0EB3F0